MSKKSWFLLSLSILITFVIVVIILKPSETDYANWMESSYQVHCLNYNCDTFQLDVKEGEEPVMMQSVRGYVSPGIFITKIERHYTSFSDSSYILNVEVEGFLGKFKIKNEEIKNVPRN
ncbi:hypothetical protein NSQ95_07585 [Psychrobacillus sp. FSL W7-1457]|uniref:hypothetical protein n=1 Tax=unclassified Psychrobacillus TaxID=2636677 RepID=UPI00315B29DC